MSITYRGVSQSSIATSIERLALRLLTLDVGPLTTKTAELWLAEDGVAARIRKAASKKDIADALALTPEGSNFSTTGWLANLYNDLLPNVFFQEKDKRAQLELQEEIRAVMLWNGFSSGGRFHAFYPEDAELMNYCKEKYGLDIFDRVTFKPGTMQGAYRGYDVFGTPSAKDTIEAIRDYARRNDLEDEFGGQDYSQQNKVYLTSRLAVCLLNDLPCLQALGLNGTLLTKQSMAELMTKHQTPPKP